ncbi:YceI family protein [Dyella sp. A6]|uniref:YceI family protein n=1 Tax=Dyella aluminiiresistens TaxID=3069105 RepID=UPI002E76DA2D|nr:YceI family protein [Dyella sp. A6]
MRPHRPVAAWLLPLLPLAPIHAAGYRIDSNSSQAVFGVRLLWLHEISGSFHHIKGSVQPGPHADSMIVAADIDVDSVTMDSARMRRWVLAKEFFDAASYPTIRFISDPVPRSTLEHGGPLPGKLSVRGVTAAEHFTLHPMHCSGPAPAPCRIELDGTLIRSEFGMTAHRATLSNRVRLNLAIVLLPIVPGTPRPADSHENAMTESQ